jgi:hypothetical protein
MLDFFRGIGIEFLRASKFRVALLAVVGIPFTIVGFLIEGVQRQIDAHGLSTTAQIEGIERRELHGGKPDYRITLSWKDAQGAIRRYQAAMITERFADSISSNGRLRQTDVAIRYLSDQPKVAPGIVDDKWAAEESSFRFYLFVTIGIMGIAASALLFWWDRARQSSATPSAAD